MVHLVVFQILWHPYAKQEAVAHRDDLLPKPELTNIKTFMLLAVKLNFKVDYGLQKVEEAFILQNKNVDPPLPTLH